MSGAPKIRSMVLLVCVLLLTGCGRREANTLSSKSQDLVTTRAAVDMKVLIEQMREQVQNIE